MKDKTSPMLAVIALTAFAAVSAQAANPASTAYVDKKFAGIQSQIDALKANPSVLHPVGSCYGGGVVFYVTRDSSAPEGQRGLIVALNDANGTQSGMGSPIDGCIPPFGGIGCQWANTAIFVNPSTSLLYFTGEQNTQNILNTSSSLYFFAAAQAASFYNNYNPPPTIPAGSPWYLPSRDELGALYFQATNSPNFGVACGFTNLVQNTYWSSSQLDYSNSWILQTSSSPTLLGVGIAGNFANVRPIRAF